MTLNTTHIIVTAAMVIIDILLCVLTFVCSSKKVTAQERQNLRDAALYETAERLSLSLFSILLVFTLFNMSCQTIIEGLIKIIEHLEVLTHG